MSESSEKLEQFKIALESLLDKVELSKVIAKATESSSPSVPYTALMHVRFQENLANVDSLAIYLGACATNYALSRRKRRELKVQLLSSDDADLFESNIIATAVRDAFLEFNTKWPHRSSEVGEVLAYCIAIEQLGATQLAAKMSLKTNNNMPVHGLDGIHGKVENGFLNIYFLESKLSATANDGAKDYAKSVAEFTNNKKQYRREYSIVKELGNLDSLPDKERQMALEYFDILAAPSEVQKRERYVGVILYSDKKSFENLPAVSDEQPPRFHEETYASTYSALLQRHQATANKHLTDNEADVNKCRVYFVVVPDKDELRELFYKSIGYIP